MYLSLAQMVRSLINSKIKIYIYIFIYCMLSIMYMTFISVIGCLLQSPAHWELIQSSCIEARLPGNIHWFPGWPLTLIDSRPTFNESNTDSMTSVPQFPMIELIHLSHFLVNQIFDWMNKIQFKHPLSEVQQDFPEGWLCDRFSRIHTSLLVSCQNSWESHSFAIFIPLWKHLDCFRVCFSW